MRVITFYEYNPIGVDCCSYASTNVALQYAYENIDMSLRISTTSMANLSTKLFSKYKFDMIRIVREKKPSIDIFYDVNTGRIECNQYDGEIKMEYNLFDMWQNGVFNE